MNLLIRYTSLVLAFCACAWALILTAQQQSQDQRKLSNGVGLPSEHYVDQPYVIECDDGSWLCTMTTSSGTEGSHYNHVVSTRSFDQGLTWTHLIDVEPAGVPQSSSKIPL